jgi:putative transposase
LMNKFNIHSIARRRKPPKKRTGLETYHRYDNLLNRDFIATRPNQKWVTDITFVSTQQGWGYLSTIKDLFDGFIVAHQFGRENSQALVNKTLQKSHSKRKGPCRVAAPQ